MTASRELVYTGFMTLDGVLDSPGGTQEGHRGGGWVFRTPFLAEAYALKGEELGETTALLFGRRSYDAFAAVWPQSPDHVDYKALPKYVVSTTLDEADGVGDWGPLTVLRTLDEVAALKATEGGAIFVHGSAELARGLQDADLIDRYNLLVFPWLLGAGKRLFSDADADARALSLRASESYDNGVTKLVYDVVR